MQNLVWPLLLLSGAPSARGGTTLGHANKTVEDGHYLDLVTRGLLWACGKLDDHGSPMLGYGKIGATAK